MPPLVVLPLTLLAAAPALHLPLEEAADGACPAHAAMAVALTQSLPGVRLERGGSASGEDLQVHARLVGERWQLEVTRADGSPLLSRTLLREGRSCEVLADASVLILEHQLQEIEWSGRPELLEQLPQEAPPEEPPAPPPVAEALPATEGVLAPPVVSPAVPAPLEAAPEATAPPPRGPGVHVSLAPGLSLAGVRRQEGGVGLEEGVGPTASLLLQAGLAPGGPWRLGVLAQAELPLARTVEVDSIERGTLHTQALLATASVGLCRAWGPLEACGAGLAGGWWLLGWTSGSTLHQQRTDSLLVPAVGPLASVALALGGRWALEATAGAVFPLGRGALAVGGTGVQRSIPLVQGLGALGVRWTPQ